MTLMALCLWLHRPAGPERMKDARVGSRSPYAAHLPQTVLPGAFYGPEQKLFHFNTAH